MEWITSETGNPDPLTAEKVKMNELAEAMIPFLHHMVDRSSDPLNTAIKAAIMGNSIDFMIHDQLHKVESLVREKLRESLSEGAYSRFTEKIRHTNNLVYFCDNSGEIVFDRLLLETMKKQYPGLKIVAVVRSKPTLNDAILKDAASTGLDRIAKVVENGIDGPLPGTIIERCSADVKNLVARADLIISKGGGNFETIQEQVPKIKKDITFMLLSKCNPHMVELGVKRYQPILFNAFNNKLKR
jgi:uncharacterized protein with ATP-grasp and redox domains